MTPADLAHKNLIKRRSKPKTAQIGEVLTLSAFPVPTFSFDMEAFNPEAGQFTVTCTPNIFNPLAMAWDLSMNVLFIGQSERARLTAECGYIFPEMGEPVVLN